MHVICYYYLKYMQKLYMIMDKNRCESNRLNYKIFSEKLISNLLIQGNVIFNFSKGNVEHGNT
jgi:hypothetical protein